MNDYKEICETLRLANSWQFAPGYVEAMLKAADAIEQLVKERDAAVMDLKAYSDCGKCKHNTYDNLRNGFCRECPVVHKTKYKWQWRGVQEVDVE